MTENKKIISVLSVSAGAGHVRAAEALCNAVELEYPSYEAVHIDVMDYVSGFFRKAYAESYIKVIDRHPALWGYLYQKSDRVEKDNSKLKKVRLAIEKLSTRKLNKKLTELNPDHIICTHFLPPELISRLKREKKTDIPCWVQVTDFDIHGLWIHERMNGYFAASSEVAHRMKDRGIDPETIHVTGIPIDPVFSDKFDRKECAKELGIRHDKPTILMMSGGLGVGGISELARRLLDLDLDCQIIALAGKNKKLLGTLQKIAENYNNRLFPMGFTKTIERVMAASDFAITKPGGLTTSECLAMELPMIIISPIPGQEERNSDYLLEKGAALKAYDAASLEFRVIELLNNMNRLDSMKKSISEISTPKAASKVLETVLRSK